MLTATAIVDGRMRSAHMPAAAAQQALQCRIGPVRSASAAPRPMGLLQPRRGCLQQAACRTRWHVPMTLQLGLGSGMRAPQRQQRLPRLGLQPASRVVRTATASNGSTAAPASAATAGATADEDGSTVSSEPARASDSALGTEDLDVRQILSDPGIEGDPLQFLKVTEAYWKALRQSKHNPGKRRPTVVTKRYRALGATDYDVCVAGGTLGVFLALALQMRGHRVCIVERRAVEGRNQEWNISRGELDVLSELGLLSAAEVDRCVVSSWNPVRVGFHGGEDLWVDDVLNIGVDPRYLIQRLRERFLQAGGTVLERTTFVGADTAPDGIVIKVSGSGAGSPVTVGDANRPAACRPEDLAASAHDEEQASTPASGSENGSSPAGSRGRDAPPSSQNGSGAAGGRSAGSRKQRGKQQLTARLLVDCMGHYSPVVKQMRGGSKPEAMVLVLGGCADGVPPEQNRSGDLLYTFTDAEDDMQLFWEAFPAAGGGRTTYMFAYADADAKRPSFEALLEKYFRLLPQYQGVPLSQLKFRRLLFGGFPCYRDAPLRPQFDRILQIGDAAAVQSPLSFGGFGAMLRHLPRLVAGVDDALRCGRLRRGDLAMLQPYQPSLSAAWLFQRSMSLKVGQLQRGKGRSHRGRAPANHVNRLMRCNFSVMRRLGDRVLRPFLQDTIRFWPLAITMLGMSFRDPIVVTRVVKLVGLRTVLGWVRHYFALAAFALLHATVGRWAARSGSFRLRRWAEAWAWGSGQDIAGAGPTAAGRPAGSQSGAQADADSSGRGNADVVVATGAAPSPT